MEHQPNEQTPDRDLLMSRVIDGEASPADWRAFRELAQQDAGVWAELGEMQRQDDALSAAVRAATDRSRGVDLPTHVVDDGPMRARFAAASTWGGWLAAACLGVMLFTGVRPQAGPVGGGTQAAGAGSGVAGLFESMTPDERFDAYVEAGKRRGDVVYAAPEPAVLRTRATDTGGVEVLVVRQIIERRVVDDVYARTVDESGRAVELPAQVREVSGSMY